MKMINPLPRKSVQMWCTHNPRLGHVFSYKIKLKNIKVPLPCHGSNWMLSYIYNKSPLSSLALLKHTQKRFGRSFWHYKSILSVSWMPKNWLTIWNHQFRPLNGCCRLTGTLGEWAGLTRVSHVLINNLSTPKVTRSQFHGLRSADLSCPILSRSLKGHPTIRNLCNESKPSKTLLGNIFLSILLRTQIPQNIYFKIKSTFK